MREYKYFATYLIISAILFWGSMEAMKLWIIISLVGSAISGAVFGVTMSILHLIIDKKKLPKEPSEILDNPFYFQLYKYCTLLFMVTCFLKYLIYE